MAEIKTKQSFGGVTIAYISPPVNEHAQANVEACKITYKDLVEGLPPLAQPFGNLHWQDPRLDQALGELVSECRAKNLPAISAIVVNGQTRQPGRRCYEVAHPAAADPLQQEIAWANELNLVARTTYPPTL